MPESSRGSDGLTHTVRVRWAECDPQGVVFNAHYLAYVDLNITELWRAAFGSYGAMLQRGVDIVVAEAQLRFFAAARFDDVLSLSVGVTHLGNTSIVSRHLVRRGEELLTAATMRHVMIDRQTGAKTPLPAWTRDGLGRWRIEPAPADATSAGRSVG
jgi:acyl-CoA thioester hydrolase